MARNGLLQDERPLIAEAPAAGLRAADLPPVFRLSFVGMSFLLSGVLVFA